MSYVPVRPFREYQALKVQLIKCQSCHHIETSQLTCFLNQLTGFYKTASLGFNELMYFISNITWSKLQFKHLKHSLFVLKSSSDTHPTMIITACTILSHLTNRHQVGWHGNRSPWTFNKIIVRISCIVKYDAPGRFPLFENKRSKSYVIDGSISYNIKWQFKWEEIYKELIK